MHLEHLNLIVSDIPATLRFYRAAFPHWEIRGGGEDAWNGKQKSWIHFGDSHQYLTFNDRGEGQNRELSGYQLGLAHFAYVTTDLKGVIARLTEAGFSDQFPGSDAPYRENVYFIDPDGYEVEFVQYHSDNPAERNTYDQ